MSRTPAKALLGWLVLALGATLTVLSPGNAMAVTTVAVDDFVSQWNGKFADYDGVYGPQCVDLFDFYNRDVVHAEFVPAKFAYQLYDAAPTDFYAKLDAPAPAAKGDVVVWGIDYPNGTVPPTGHVAIVLEDTGSSLKILTQTPGATRQQTTSKAFVRGYLRPISD